MSCIVFVKFIPVLCGILIIFFYTNQQKFEFDSTKKNTFCINAISLSRIRRICVWGTVFTSQSRERNSIKFLKWNMKHRISSITTLPVLGYKGWFIIKGNSEFFTLIVQTTAAILFCHLRIHWFDIKQVECCKLSLPQAEKKVVKPNSIKTFGGHLHSNCKEFYLHVTFVGSRQQQVWKESLVHFLFFLTELLMML
jgi:hypothetical protein